MKWRPLRTEERQLTYLWGVVVIASISLRRLWLALPPFLPRCAFRQLTGIPCPTCGSTHAAIALLHGELLRALAANPLVTLTGVAFAAGGLIAPVWALTRLPIPAVSLKFPLWARVAAVLIILANWIYLILTLGPR